MTETALELMTEDKLKSNYDYSPTVDDVSVEKTGRERSGPLDSSNS